MSPQHMRRVGVPLAILLCGFLIGLGTMWFFTNRTIEESLQSDASIRQVGKYKLIAPLLVCGITQPKNFTEYESLHDKLQHVIDRAKQSGKAAEVSVYFRGFSGKWVGIDENKSYAPASLLKVPIMIAYFKEAETNPAILEREYEYDGKVDLNQAETFKTQYDIKPGVYKVKDLIKAMIVNSDNNAADILNKALDTNSLTEVYTDLGLTVPDENNPTAQLISAKGYSYFFRILYNATYLTPEYSEQALELLDAPDFSQGIRGGLPAEVSIAQKFGERTITDPHGAVLERDLHDCGLIYAGKSPYLLCVMTKGTDFKNLSSVIQEISATTYAEAQKLQ